MRMFKVVAQHCFTAQRIERTVLAVNAADAARTFAEKLNNSAFYVVSITKERYQ